MMIAADKGSVECLTVLLAHGADVNAKINNGTTALMYAADKGIFAGLNVKFKYAECLS